MGYVTHYKLKVEELERQTSDSIITDLREENEEAKYALDENGETEEGCKWYEHEKEIIAFSKKYPNRLFILSGEGEEAGDIWKKYFVNGKIQIAKAEVSVADFDGTKLK